MDHYKAVVMQYVQADRTFFVNTECCIRLDGRETPEKAGPHWFCDAVAIDLRHRAVYLCDVAYKLQALFKKIAAWAQHWDGVKTSLERDCQLPAGWRIRFWLFVPKELIEELDAKLEELRRMPGCPFKVKITALEDVQPWRLGNWGHADRVADQTVRGLEMI